MYDIFPIHFLLEPQVYIFVYKPVTRLTFSHIRSAQFDNLCNFKIALHNLQISNLCANLQIGLTILKLRNDTCTILKLHNDACTISKLCNNTCTILKLCNQQAHSFKGQALMRALSFTEKC